MKNVLLPWRVSMTSLLASVYGMSVLEVRRLPLALVLLYACAAAQHEGLSTRWREVVAVRDENGVKARLAQLRGKRSPL